MVVVWLDLDNIYGSMPHKLVQETLKRHQVSTSVGRYLILDCYSDFSLNLFRINNIRVAPTACGNQHALYHLSDPFILVMNMLVKFSELECRDPKFKSRIHQFS